MGAGNFTSATILPNLKKIGAKVKYIASSGGLTGTIMAKKYAISNSTTDYSEILQDDEVDLVLITTRHNMHAAMVLEAIKAGKSVFVEKPLAIRETEMEDIIAAYMDAQVQVSVGFNRQYSGWGMHECHGYPSSRKYGQCLYFIEIRKRIQCGNQLFLQWVQGLLQGTCRSIFTGAYPCDGQLEKTEGLRL